MHIAFVVMNHQNVCDMMDDIFSGLRHLHWGADRQVSFGLYHPQRLLSDGLRKDVNDRLETLRR
jgi:hypothetical protein